MWCFYGSIDTGVKMGLLDGETRGIRPEEAGEFAFGREGRMMLAKRISNMRASLAGAAAIIALATAGSAQAEAPKLLFHVSADRSLVADQAGGDAVPNFQDKVRIVPTGAIGGAIQWDDDGVVTWNAPGNIYAQRGTLAFFWRSRTPVGEAPFNIFRVGYADHTSWDMAWLRIDWNGHGFDAFVTDANLARSRVSFTIPQSPRPDEWHHIAFSWDETVGVRLYVDGREAARKDIKPITTAGSTSLASPGRVVSPHQVQSRYHFMRGSDVDEIRVYDRMLAPQAVAALASKQEPDAAAPVATSAVRAALAASLRLGPGQPAGPERARHPHPQGRVRRREGSEAMDVEGRRRH